PFSPTDCKNLYDDAKFIIAQKCPEIASAFKQRGWDLPDTLDRVYDSSSAQNKLGWLPIYGFNSVLEMLDAEIAEVLPISKRN
ncbi:NAD(P)-dependent oxidoreductase, partial [Photobacterium toruni]|nr:NAD(P)-dependent oxidoreductase [Photobacterium toruni]